MVILCWLIYNVCMNEISGCVAYRRKKIDKPYRKKGTVSSVLDGKKGKEKDVGSK